MDFLDSPLSWGDRGIEIARLIATGEKRALEAQRKDLATAMAMAQAYFSIQNHLPPALQLRSLRVFREELAKQGC